MHDDGKSFVDWSNEYTEEQFDHVKQLCDVAQLQERSGRRFAVALVNTTEKVLH